MKARGKHYENQIATIGVLVMLQVTAWASTETVVGISSDLETGMAPRATSSSIPRVTFTV
jgi:hypothetical protein